MPPPSHARRLLRAAQQKQRQQQPVARSQQAATAGDVKNAGKDEEATKQQAHKHRYADPNEARVGGEHAVRLRIGGALGMQSVDLYAHPFILRTCSRVLGDLLDSCCGSGGGEGGGSNEGGGVTTPNGGPTSGAAGASATTGGDGGSSASSSTISGTPNSWAGTSSSSPSFSTSSSSSRMAFSGAAPCGGSGGGGSGSATMVTIPLDDADADAWDEALAFMYAPGAGAGRFEVTAANAERLLVLADKYDMPGLVSAVAAFLCRPDPAAPSGSEATNLDRLLTAASAWRWLQLTHRCGLRALARRCGE